MTKTLRREVGLAGAVMLGLGSIVGTGVFVSIGIAAGVAGPAVVVAIGIAAFVALCNALSSAQLAAAHPVAGGTYEYGYRLLSPALGFTAGWMFLCAKSASAATAALGFAAYAFPESSLDGPIAVAAVVGVVVLVLTGLRRSNIVNTAIVSITLASLAWFVACGFGPALDQYGTTMAPLFDQHGVRDLLAGSALMFVAFTGYGRIATLGEEVRDPRGTIPKAIVVTIAVSAITYLLVGFVAVASRGAGFISDDPAPLDRVAAALEMPGGRIILAVGAVTAMLGVLLNLILGLSRVVLAMGRRGDLPKLFARVDDSGRAPGPAVLLVGVVVASIAAASGIEVAWSFSAFTVLIYYALTNLAALRLPTEARLHPRVFAWLGLIGCLGLAFWIEPRVWIAGLAIIGIGLGWHAAARRTVAA